jgi:hypothetical protein
VLHVTALQAKGLSWNLLRAATARNYRGGAQESAPRLYTARTLLSDEDPEEERRALTTPRRKRAA